MAVFGDQRTVTAKAAADLSGKQYHFVIWSAAGTVNQATSATAETHAGVLQNKPAAANRAATVAYDGDTKITAGGSITVNNLITTNSSGRATAAASGDMVMGRAIEAAGADGDIIRMLMAPAFFSGDLA